MNTRLEQKLVTYIDPKTKRARRVPRSQAKAKLLREQENRERQALLTNWR